MRLVGGVTAFPRFDSHRGGRQSDDAPCPRRVATHLQVIPRDPDLDLVHLQPKPRRSADFDDAVPFSFAQGSRISGERATAPVPTHEDGVD